MRDIRHIQYEPNDLLLRRRISDILFDTGYPDYAIALTGFRKVVGTSEIPIAGTDYANLYINPDFTDDEISVIVRHEILHVILNHRKRMQSHHKPMLWNMAIDYELSNYYSYYDDIVIANNERLRSGCSIAMQPEYQNMTAEEIYDKLLEDVQSGSSSDDTSDGESGESGGGESGGESDDTSGYDPHLDLSQDEQEELRDAMQKAVEQVYETLTDDEKEKLATSPLKPVGRSGLGGMADVFNQTSPPEPEEVNLYYDLRRFFLQQQNIGKGRSYKRPNKKYQHSKMKLLKNFGKPK